MTSNIEKIYADISYNTDLKDYGKTFRDHSDRESQYIIDLNFFEEFNTMDPTTFLYFLDFAPSTRYNSHSTIL